MSQRTLRRPARAARALALALATLALAVLVGGCEGGGSAKPKHAQGPPPRPAQNAPPARSFLERLIPPQGGVLPGARVPGQIGRLVASLPVERKVAQLLLVGFDGRDPSAPFFATLRRLDLGGVAIEKRNYSGAQSLATLTAAIGRAARGGAHEPPFVVAPQEGGQFSAFGDLPPFQAPGHYASLRDATSEAQQAARTLKRLGLNGVLAPDVDVGGSTPDPLGPRAYSDDPNDVRRYATAVVDVYRSAGMLTAPSHFPGIGAASDSTDQGPAEVGLSMHALSERDLRPFRAAIRAGTQAVLVGHASYAPDSFVVPGSLSHAIETNLLRGSLGFRGIAITDDLEAGAIVAGNTVAKAAVQAIQAGADMVWISGPESDWADAYSALLAAVRSHAIPLARLNDAVTRIVTVKGELGLRARR